MSESLRAAFGRVLWRRGPRPAIRRGRLERIDAFESQSLGNARRITVYLPPGYDDVPEQRFPVLYMQDGQNLFEGHRAFVPGEHWRLMEAADAAICGRTAKAVIIVGVDHAGAGRMAEFTSSPDPEHVAGGLADDYGRMLVDELKPFIEGQYRTLPGESAVGGSSLGGLLSLHLMLARGDVFRRVAAMSPSVWWNGRAILRELEVWRGNPARLWLDVGGREGAVALRDVRDLRDALRRKGWTDATLRFHEDRRGDHSERAWARRARRMLEFLFPPA